MSLRKKVVGILLLVFAIYCVTASLVLSQLQGRSYIELEQRAIVEQLLRTRDIIRIHGDYIENMVLDWAYWEDTWLYAQGKNDDFYDSNLASGYLGTLGFDFVIVLDRDGNAIFEEAYSDKKGKVDSSFSILPNGISSVNALIKSTSIYYKHRGWISTNNGPALITAHKIISEDGLIGGYFILGRVLNQKLLKELSTSIHSTVDLLPIDLSTTTIPAEFQAAVDELLISGVAHVMVKTDEEIYAMNLIKNLDDQPIAALRVGMASDITALGESSMKVSIVILMLAVLIVTASLWALLQGTMVSPIERLTRILRKINVPSASGDANHQLSGAVKDLEYWRNSMSVATRGNEIGELVGAFQKMSTSLDDAASRIWVLAHVDELSNLANRRLFTEQLSDKLEQAKNQFTQIAVMFVDLDDFKPINDRLGHRAGDGVLIDFAWRLNLLLKMPATIGKNQYSQLRDLPARIGGDEFVIMLSGDDLSERAPEVAAKIIYAASTPFEVAGELFSISASVGLAVFPDDSDTVEALLHNADTAMYEAKRSGKNVWVKYHN